MNALTRWSSAALAGEDRGAAWRDVVEKVWGPCSLIRSLPQDFDAALSLRRAGKLCVSDSIFDPFEGRTTFRSARKPSVFSVQLVVSGEKRVSSEGEAVVLRQGDVFIDLALKANDFQVRERCRTLLISMPVTRLKAWRPAASPRARYRFDAETPVAKVLGANIQSISEAFLAGSLGNGPALSEAVLGLVVAAISGEDGPTGGKQAKLASIKRWIQDRLEDPDITPAMIATANRISLRYLHYLFAAEGGTVQQFLIRERLARGRRDLGNPCLHNQSVTDIAYGSGFSSLTHFSKRFRDEFGVSPTQFRAKALGDLAG